MNLTIAAKPNIQTQLVSASTHPPDCPTAVNYNVILGCPRSGTTFLIDSLKSLPNSECITGHLFPLAIAHLINQPISSDTYDCLSRSFEFSIQDYLSSIEKATAPAAYRWLCQNLTTKELIQALRGERVIKRVLYKEPFLAFAPEFTYHALPGCKIVHIYRDGRDCADSLMRKYQVLTDEKLTAQNTAEMPIGRKYDHRYVPWWVAAGREAAFMACSPYVRAVWMWKEMAHRCHEFSSNPDVVQSQRVLSLKYEDLVERPLYWGERVVEHFGCQMNSRISQALESAHSSSVGIYRRRSADEIQSANNVAEAELQLYGYSTTTSS